MSKPGSERGFSRRDVLKMAVGASLGSLIDSDDVRKEVRRETLPREVDEKIEGYAGDVRYVLSLSGEVRDAFTSGGHSEKHLAQMQAYLEQSSVPKIVQDIKKKYPAIPEKEISLELNLNRAKQEVISVADKALGERVKHLGEEAVVDAVDFWNHPRLVRPEHVEFRVPASYTREMFGSFPEDPRVVVDILNRQGVRYEGKITSNIDRNAYWNFHYFSPTLAGSVVRDVRAKDNQLTWKHSQVHWMLNGDTDTSRHLVRILPTEILHLQLGSITEERQNEEIRKKGKVEKTPAFLRPAQLGEAVVHSIGLLWYEAYQEKKGHPLTDGERKNILKNDYTGVEQLYDRLKTHGGRLEIERLINDFIDRPEVLYAETGL